MLWLIYTSVHIWTAALPKRTDSSTAAKVWRVGDDVIGVALGSTHMLTLTARLRPQIGAFL